MKAYPEDATAQADEQRHAAGLENAWSEWRACGEGQTPFVDYIYNVRVAYHKSQLQVLFTRPRPSYSLRFYNLLYRLTFL